MPFLSELTVYGGGGGMHTAYVSVSAIVRDMQALKKGID